MNLFDDTLFGSRSRRRPDANIDMTPMIDTLLQLFVVFMLNMSFILSTVHLDLPKASAQPTPHDTPLVVALQAKCARSRCARDGRSSRGQNPARLA